MQKLRDKCFLLISLCLTIPTAFAITGFGTTSPISKSTIMSADEFSSKIKTLNQQTKSSLAQEVGQSLTKNPPLDNKSLPSTQPATQAVADTSISNAAPAAPTRPTSPTTAPGYTGFGTGSAPATSAPPASAPATGGSKSGGWNIKY